MRVVIFLLICFWSYTVVGQEQSIGVVCLKDDIQDFTLTFYKSNGDILKKINFNDNFKDSDFQPHALSAENILLVFKCISYSDMYYKVLLNESKNTYAFIKRGDNHFKFETWDKHILSVPSVNFNEKLNPLRKEPDVNSKTINVDTIDFFEPVEIKGNWLKIKWETPFLGYGWIKWKNENGKILVDLVYSL